MEDSDSVTFKKLKSQDVSEHSDDDLVEDETCSGQFENESPCAPQYNMSINTADGANVHNNLVKMISDISNNLQSSVRSVKEELLSYLTEVDDKLHNMQQQLNSTKFHKENVNCHVPIVLW